MPPKKHKSEEEPDNPEPIGRRRTRSASLGPPAMPPPPTPSSRATTRSRARQDGTTEIPDDLPAPIKRVPSRKKSASPMRNTKTPGLRIYSDSPTARSEDGPSESTDKSEVNTPTALPISAHLGEGDLSTLLEADESDFSTHETSDRTVPSHFGPPVPGNGTTAGPALKRSLKHNAVHFTNSVKFSSNRGPAASHVSGSGPAPVVASTSATVTTKTVTKSISGPVPVSVSATAPPQPAPRVSFINSFLNGVSDQVSNLDAWTVSQYIKLAANRYWKFFGLTLLGLLILLFLGPFYTHYQYNSADNSIDKFSSHLRNASLQTRNMSKRLVIIEDQVANLDAIMVTKEEFKAYQAERRQLNWLSRILGANVILGLTSPAIPANITVKSSWWSHLWYSNSLPTGPGPDAALLPQKRGDPNPTYCVQKKEGRVKLQLAVSLRRYITPTKLIIEHWPKSEVGFFHKLISAATAPREVELWVYNERARTKKEDINAIQWEVEQHFRNNRVNEARVEKKLRLELHSPDDAGYTNSWLMVGRWKYDIYSLHNVQKFLIPFDLEAYNFSTKSVVVRVNSNWGSSYATCLLRARLNGIDKTESKAEESEIKKNADGYEDEDRDDL